MKVFMFFAIINLSSTTARLGGVVAKVRHNQNSCTVCLSWISKGMITLSN